MNFQFSRSGLDSTNLHFLRFPGDARNVPHLERPDWTTASLACCGYPDVVTVRADGISVGTGFCGRGYSLMHHTAVLYSGRRDKFLNRVIHLRTSSLSVILVNNNKGPDSRALPAFNCLFSFPCSTLVSSSLLTGVFSAAI